MEENGAYSDEINTFYASAINTIKKLQCFSKFLKLYCKLRQSYFSSGFIKTNTVLISHHELGTILMECK